MGDEKLILRCERHENLGVPECDIVEAMSWQIGQLEAQLAEKDVFIAGMVNRPVYDEQQRRIADLEAALEIVTSSLHYEIMCRYGDYIHPAMQGKYDSDMTEVVDARKVLNSKGSE